MELEERPKDEGGGEPAGDDREEAEEEPRAVEPEDPKRWGRRALGWVVGLALVAAALTFGLHQLQALHVLNPAQCEAQVAVAGKSVTVAPGKQAKVFVPEGEHQVQVRLANGVTRTTTIKVSNAFRERLARSSLFVFVVLAAGALSAEEHYYSRGPLEAAPPPPVVYAGRDFYAFRGVDFAFEGSPESLASTSASGPFTRIRTVNSVWTAPEVLVRQAGRDGLQFPQVQVRSYAEGQLWGGNRSREMVDAYLEYCVRSSCEGEARALLASVGVQVGAREVP